MCAAVIGISVRWKPCPEEKGIKTSRDPDITAGHRLETLP